jgi:hypothetical protein
VESISSQSIYNSLLGWEVQVLHISEFGIGFWVRLGKGMEEKVRKDLA